MAEQQIPVAPTAVTEPIKVVFQEESPEPPVRTRPDWDTYFLQGARWVATRADCTRRQVGAIIVKENRIMATGYNGGPSKGKSCLKGECPRGRHYERLDQAGVSFCACGETWPCPEWAPGYETSTPSSYDVGKGACIALHAEQNAMLYCSLEQRQGATIYVTSMPCPGCFRELRGSGIEVIVWPEGRERKWINGRWYRRVEGQMMDEEVG